LTKFQYGQLQMNNWYEQIQLERVEKWDTDKPWFSTKENVIVREYKGQNQQTSFSDVFPSRVTPVYVRVYMCPRAVSNLRDQSASRDVATAGTIVIREAHLYVQRTALERRRLQVNEGGT